MQSVSQFAFEILPVIDSLSKLLWHCYQYSGILIAGSTPRPLRSPSSISVRQLVRDMAETMYAAPGIGLAATQVNVHAGDRHRYFRGPQPPPGAGEPR